MTIGEMSLLGAFLIGLAHTLEPCEDKAVVSLFVIWATRRLREAIYLVVIYGLGMAFIDTLLGFIASLLGVSLLEEYRSALEITAGGFTFIFGCLILWSKQWHLGHHHGEMVTANPEIKAISIFGLGLIRGLPPCPIELAILAWAASLGGVIQGTFMVFLFGLGTTLGLIPLGLIMGGLAGAISKTRYQAIMPRLTAILFMVIGLIILVSSFIGWEW